MGKHLRAAYEGADRWLASPGGRLAIRGTRELLKWYIRFKGIDVDLGDDPPER
ncbi:hypothetical protein [Streptomyces luteireticuli]|uniref:hypothetical protein n=1 Tax=Streptomyces luteireticuli TaxID=173858 RepID=UPI0031D270E4